MHTIIILILAAPGLILSFHRPWLGSLWVIGFLLPLIAYDATEYSMLSRGVFLFLIFANVLGCIVHKNGLVYCPPLGLAIIVSAMAYAVSGVIAISQDISVLTWFKSTHFFLGIMLYFPIMSEFSSRRRIHHLLTVLVLTTTAMVMTEIYMTISSGNLFQRYLQLDTTTGFFRSTLYLPTMMILIAAVRYIRSDLLRLALILLLCLFLWRLMIGYRRQPLVLLVIGLLLMYYFYALYERKLRALVPFLLSIMVVSGVFGALLSIGVIDIQTIVPDGFLRRFDPAVFAAGLELRFRMIEIAWSQFMANPIFGAGFGSYIEIIVDVERTGGRGLRTVEIEKIHSFYLASLAYGGLLVSIPIAYLMVNIINLLHRRPLSVNRWSLVMAAFAGSIVMLFLLGIFSTKLFRLDTWTYIGVVLGMFHASYQYQFEKT